MKEQNIINVLEKENKNLVLQNEELKQENKIYLLSINILLLTLISILILFYFKYTY